MEAFRQRVVAHTEHIKKVAEYCTTEETTKQALILPLLDILGFSAFDPTKVRAEHVADFPGAKAGERVDYALFSNGVPVMFVEAKACSQNLTNHCPQLSRYYNATPEVAIAAITNGREWRFFTDLANKNIMDEKPFLVLHLDNPGEDTPEQLMRFHYDQFQPDALRALAEESIYLSSFRETLGSILKECDIDFVKYVAGRANIQRTFTAKFLEQMQPIVKQALAQSVSSLVATSLNKTPIPVAEVEPTVAAPDVNAPLVDPLNSKIVTTASERKLLEIVSDALSGEDIQGRDTESYYTVLFQGKTNRWILRYWGDKKIPRVQFGIILTENHKEEILRAKLTLGPNDYLILEKPEHLIRITGILNDALLFCKDDNNFKRKSE